MSIFLKWRQSCGGSSCCRLLRTFDFISSRPTVATVLGCGLLLLSSFCGLSRRCSRCFIIWSPRRTERRRGGGVKQQEKIEGREKQGGSRRVKGSFPMMSNPSPTFYFIHTCLAVSRLKGLKAIQLRQELISPSVLVAPSERILVFSSLEIE